MNPRLFILIVLAAGLAVSFAALKGRAKPDLPPVDESAEYDDLPVDTLDKHDLAGEEPDEEPDLSVQVEVDRTKGKNRLYFTLSEAHGFYVEQFRIRFWWVGGGATEENSPLVLYQFFDRYMPAKENLRLCLEVVPAELQKVGGDIGSTSDWNSEVEWHGRWRTKSPNPLPMRTDLEGLCD